MKDYPDCRLPSRSTASWSDERADMLRKLWADGLSCSQIAAELGGITRNAVIGKVHRLGLGGRARRVSNRPPRRPRATHRAVGRSRLAALFNVALGGPSLAPEPPPDIDDTTIPVAQRRTILELTGATCRWPVGDPKSPDFFFCGGDPLCAFPYCAAHALRAGNGYARAA